MEFTNKTVIVTGASRGMGYAAAKAFAQNGANVVLVSRKKEDVERAAKEFGLPESRYLAVGADISKSEGVRSYIDATMDKFGRIDAVFSNAGVSGTDKLLVDVTDEEFDRCIDTNLKSTFYMLKGVLPIMSAQRSGSIIVNSALGALRVLPGMAEYAAAKSGILSLMRSAAVENASMNVRVNAIVPGTINTSMVKNFEVAQGITDENRDEVLAKLLPMGRYGTPEELADLVLFLASDKSTYINGVAIRIDGASGT